MELKSLTLLLDEDDSASVNEAITYLQKTDHAAFGETMLPEGDSSFAGAIIAEICRAYLEYNDWFDMFNEQK